MGAATDDSGYPDDLNQYPEKNLPQVQLSIWVSSGLSAEVATVAQELRRCIVDAPESSGYQGGIGGLTDMDRNYYK